MAITSLSHDQDSVTTAQSLSISDSVTRTVQQYFSNLDGSQPIELYNFVLEEVEGPLLQAVMRHTKNNQSQAARLLGLARGTLRTKLKKYFDDTYITME